MLQNWNKDLEKQVIQEFLDKKIFEFKDDDKPLFSIDTPPPYLNRPIHIGQGSTYAIMDMIARYKRMKGYKVLFPLGLDRNGLPIEMEAEKKYNINIKTTDRLEYISKCQEILKEYSNKTQESYKMMGISFNEWTVNDKIGSVYETDSKEYRTLTQKTFIDLYKKGLIYEDEKITNYCPGCKTTIADSEIDYKDIDSVFYTVLFKVKETNEHIPIATTRPELIPSLGMIVFNPEDERWQHLEGKTAISPLFNREVPIKAHTIAKADKGSGLVMMCSAGDYSDIRFFREQGLKPIISIDVSGTMNSNTGFLEGLSVKAARKKVVEELKANDLITAERTIKHSVPVCERSGHEIEFIALKEFYLKQMDYIEKIRKIADEINFSNPASKKILLDWLDAIATDWPISRRRYYATEIPIWYCEKCQEVILGKPGKYQQPWCESPPIDKCPKCGNNRFIGETRVLDTWFDSSNSAMYIHKYEQDFFKKHPVCSLRPQGKEIVRTWLYYTLLKTYLVNGTRAFDDVYIHQHILDENGYKMSKSKNNVVDPQEIINLYGAECFRLWVAYEGNLDQKDFKCSKERIAPEQKTLNKLWNVAKFVSQFNKKSEKIKLTEIDYLIREDINKIIEYADKCYANYDFHNPVVKLKHFLWDTLSSHYLELVKSRCYNQDNLFSEEEQNAAIDTLNYCFKHMLYCLYPVTPFITKILLQEMYSKDVYSAKYPKPENYKSELKIEDLEKLNNTLWKFKKDANKSLKDTIDQATLPHIYKTIEKDIISTHNIKDIKYHDKEDILIR